MPGVFMLPFISKDVLQEIIEPHIICQHSKEHCGSSDPKGRFLRELESQQHDVNMTFTSLSRPPTLT